MAPVIAADRTRPADGRRQLDAEAADGISAIHAKLLAPDVVEAVADIFRLLSDPTRVRLVDVLSHGERCVTDLATLAGLTKSAASHQLRLLRSARLVRARRTGRRAYYSLDDRHVAGLVHDTRRHVEETARPAPPADMTGT
jgi:DNA-binding transcriptional ArsR family regulator